MHFDLSELEPRPTTLINTSCALMSSIDQKPAFKSFNIHGIGKDTETESEMEDPEFLISQLETEASSNMIQAINDGAIQPTHSLFELKMQILNGKQANETATFCQSAKPQQQLTVHPMYQSTFQAGEIGAATGSNQSESALFQKLQYQQ